MNAPVPALALATLAWAPLSAAVIPPETVQQDVFGAGNYFAQEVDDPHLGSQLWFNFEGFTDFNYEILSTEDLATWNSRGFEVATGGAGLFIEPFPADNRRFYQAAIAGSGDSNPPTWPAPATGAPFSADNIESHAVDLDWPAAADDTGIVAYALYLDNVHLATLAPTDLGTFVDGLEPNTEYEFDLFACDSGANCTAYPITLTIRTRTQQEPYLNSALAGSAFLSSGEFTLSRTDLAIPARELAFVFTRTYRSDFEKSGPLGYGWTANVFERLRERSSGDVVWLQGIGRADTFAAQPGGGYLAPPGVFMTLTKDAGGFRLLDSTGTRRRFDLNGRILSLSTRNDNTLTYNRTGARLTSLTDDMGRETMLIYGADDRIERIRDFTGREVEFTYDTAGNLVSARSPLVTGTPNGNDFAAGKIERYLYDTANPDPDLAHNLVGVISPNEVADASLTPSQSMTYGSAGDTHDRIRTHTIGGTNAGGVPAGGTVTYSYTPNLTPGAIGLISRTTVTDRRGNDVHHDFAPTGHLERRIEVLTSRPDPITSYTYDDQGNVLSITRPEGNVTTYAYDSSNSSRRSRGNLLTLTHTPGPRGADQANLVTTFTYEPIFNQVRTLTDPRGFTSTNTFDYEESCNFAAIGAKVGLSATEAQTLLQSAGMCNGGPLADVNGDGVTDQVSGYLIRRAHPTVALDPASNQAALEGDPIQDIVTHHAYNQFGQRLFIVNAEENTTRYRYFPEQDPNGDAIIDNPAGDPSTGGYLRQVEADAEAIPATRNSGNGAAPVKAHAEFEYNPRGALTRLIDGRGVATDVIRNDLDEAVRILRAAATGTLSAPVVPPEPIPLTNFQFLGDTYYDHNGNVVRTEVEDRDDTSATGGLVASLHAYDILNRPVQVAREVGGGSPDLVTRFRYDPNGNLALAILPEGNATAALYEERNLPVNGTRGALSPPAEALLGAGDPLTYDVRGGVASTVTFHYDDNRNRDRTEDAADTDGSAANNGPSGGERSTFTYDGYDRLVQAVDPVGNGAIFAYDPNSNLLSRQRFGPDGGATPLSDTPSANLLADTSFHYDEINRLVQVDRFLFANGAADIQEGATGLGKGDLVPGDGAVNARIEYDRLGRRTFLVQDDEDASSFSYDGMGRLVHAVDPLANSADFAYDDNSNLIETRETDVATVPGVADEIFLTTRLYDSLNRLTAIADNLGHTTRFDYDSRDNLVSVSDPNGPLTGATITRRAFSAGPLTVNAINDHGNVARYTYDGLNRLLTNERVLTVSGFGDGTLAPAPDPAQGGGDGLIRTHAQYDKDSLVEVRTDDRGFQTGYSYDNLNRLIAQERGICPGAAPPGYRCDPPTTVTYAWDPDHNLIRKIDEIGSVLDYTYDGINRAVDLGVTPGAGVIGSSAKHYEYDGLGRLTRSLDDNGDPTNDAVECLFRYDSLSRVVEEALLPDPGSVAAVTQHAWRAENLRAHLLYPSGRTLDYLYDTLDRPLEVRDSGGLTALAEFDYIGTGRLLETRYPPNGTRHTHLDNAGTTDLGYDGIRRAIALRDLDGSNNVLTGFGHTYDRTSNRLTEQKLHDPANNEVYTYDSAYRLTGLTRSGLGSAPLLHSSWQIDGNNNWNQVDSEQREHSSFNEITRRLPVVPIIVSSDDNGNVRNNGVGLSYQWDAFDRLVAVQQGGTPIARYYYDAAGRRVRKENSNLGSALNGTTEYLHDGAHVIAERSGTGATQRQFVFGPGVDNPLRMDDVVAGAGYYFHQNTLGSTFALSNAATGNVVERMRYDAYGNPAVFQLGGASPTRNPFLFTARRFDPATGNYYYRARYLDPVQGRFLGRDPLGIWGDPPNRGNAYAYCANNPINCVDPSGLGLISADFEGTVKIQAEVIGDDGQLAYEQSVAGQGLKAAASVGLYGGYSFDFFHAPGDRQTASASYNEGDTATHEVGHYLGFSDLGPRSAKTVAQSKSFHSAPASTFVSMIGQQESIVIHEVGHLLGLQHSPILASTMYVRTPQSDRQHAQANSIILHEGAHFYGIRARGRAGKRYRWDFDSDGPILEARNNSDSGQCGDYIVQYCRAKQNLDLGPSTYDLEDESGILNLPPAIVGSAQSDRQRVRAETSSDWRDIAAANGIADPMDLLP